MRTSIVAALVFVALATSSAATTAVPVVTFHGAGPSGVAARPRADARTESEHVVGLIRMPPDAVRVASSPAAALRRVPQRPATPYLVDISRWWRLRMMPMVSALSWLRAHPPAGLDLAGSGSGSGPCGPFAYLIYEDTSTAAYNSATLLIEVAPDGPDASAVRADGQTTWIPPRPSATDVPLDGSEAQLLVYRGEPTHVLARRTLNGAAALRLARVVNRLPRDNRGAHGCLADTGLRVRMTFVTARGTLVFTEWPACSAVGVTVNGQARPGLLDSVALRRVLADALGRHRASILSG
jgi:hypothetical protein